LWDVYRGPGDFVEHTSRSFSSKSDIVDIFRSVIIKTQQAASIVASTKQVPGLGAAGRDENTDEQLVTINSSLKELQSVDMDPYKTAIAAGVAVHPALDASIPRDLVWLGSSMSYTVDLGSRVRPLLMVLKRGH
jgi:beta-N-acetylhexosaminidase